MHILQNLLQKYQCNPLIIRVEDNKLFEYYKKSYNSKKIEEHCNTLTINNRMADICVVRKIISFCH